MILKLILKFVLGNVINEVQQSSLNESCGFLRVRRLNNTGTFFCDRCGKTYVHKKDLSKHKRLACGKKPQFQCLYCSKQCFYKCALESHMKSKHGVNFSEKIHDEDQLTSVRFKL